MNRSPGSSPRRLATPRYGRALMPVALLTPTTMGTRSGSRWSRAVRTRSRGVRDTRVILRFERRWRQYGVRRRPVARPPDGPDPWSRGDPTAARTRGAPGDALGRPARSATFPAPRTLRALGDLP